MKRIFLFLVLGLALPGYSPHAEERIAQRQPVHDTIVSRWVRSALHADPTTRTGAINVATRSSHVILKGFALNKKQAKRAVEIARAVRGVKSVRDELVIMNRK
ncbi:MAG: BON domain-containing protein [Gammaproteobacteria bacterium]